MNRTKIEWCSHTWNPVVGCKTGCSYCYAEQINRRFKFIPDWKDPQFFPERLHDPFGKPSATIFVGSMCDLFGHWVPDEWIEKIIITAIHTDWHEYMFLTKYPKRYKDFEFPDNVMLGATIEDSGFQSMVKLNDLVSEYDNPNRSIRKFLSIEPIQDSFEGVKFLVDLVIVGAMTGAGAIKTEPEWIESVKHHNVFLKDSAKKVLQQQITTADLKAIDKANGD